MCVVKTSASEFGGLDYKWIHSLSPVLCLSLCQILGNNHLNLDTLVTYRPQAELQTLQSNKRGPRTAVVNTFCVIL